MAGMSKNELARQLRVKADAYEDFKEDTYLHCLLADAADAIDLLTEQVNVLSTKAGVAACDAKQLAQMRFRIDELYRRSNSMLATIDQLEKEVRDDTDHA
jgi:hypothetical protein